jgi:alpha-beta hydrolase superfamily lysophospholipase
LDAWYSSVDSSKGCVIFFHGITVNKSFVQKEAAMFRQWGYNVLLVDFRGHGKSTGNKSSYGIHEADDVQHAVEWAKQKGNEKIILYGVSLGAAACIKAIADHKVQPLALIADMPFATVHHYFKSRARGQGFPAEPFATLVTFWIGTEGGYNAFNHDVREYAKQLHCPVLVEWGEKDRYVQRDDIEAVYANISSDRKKLLVYPRADHESFLNVDPNTWEREVQSFVGSL